MWLRRASVASLLLVVMMWTVPSAAWAVPTPTPVPSPTRVPRDSDLCWLTDDGNDVESPMWYLCSEIPAPSGGWCLSVEWDGNNPVTTQIGRWGYYFPCSLGSVAIPSPSASSGSSLPSASASGDPSPSSVSSPTAGPGSSFSASASASPHVWTDEEASELVATMRGLLIAAGMAVLCLGGLLVMSVRR